MYALFALIFMIAIMTNMDTSASARADHKDSHAEALAIQMMAYHQAALKWCNDTACPAGSVDPTAYLPEIAQGAPIYTSGIFKSQSVGNMVYTYLDTNVPGAAALAPGAVSGSLHKKLEGQVGAGSYNPQTGNIGGNSVRKPNPRGQVENAIVEVNVGVAAMPAGAPVLATRK